MTNENEKDKDVKKIEKVGDKPLNARIYINYEQDPPTISFDYPDTNTNQIRHSSITYLIAALITFILLMAIIIGWTNFMHDTFFKDTYANDYQLKNAKSITYNNSNYSDIIIEYKWNNKDYTTFIQFQKMGTFWYYPTFTPMNSQKNLFYDLIPALVLYTLFIVIFILNTKWITLVFTKTKWGHKTFPEINKRLHSKGYTAEFLPKDFDELGYTRTSDGRWFIELPLFQNMYMDYEATEEFSKYLAKISIVEHPFSRFVKKKGVSLTKIKRAKKKAKNSSEMDIYYDKKTNIYLWKTIYEFKQKPTTGYLRLWFTVWMCLLMGIFIVFII